MHKAIKNAKQHGQFSLSDAYECFDTLLGYTFVRSNKVIFIFQKEQILERYIG